jgi:hypothetical protein
MKRLSRPLLSASLAILGAATGTSAEPDVKIGKYVSVCPFELPTAQVIWPMLAWSNH